MWSISYRRVGHAGGGSPGTFLDVARGADRLRVLAQRYPLDLNRLVATGHFELIAPWTPAGKEVVKRIVDAIPPRR